MITGDVMASSLAVEPSAPSTLAKVLSVSCSENAPASLYVAVVLTITPAVAARLTPSVPKVAVHAVPAHADTVAVGVPV